MKSIIHTTNFSLKILQISKSWSGIFYNSNTKINSNITLKTSNTLNNFKMQLDKIIMDKYNLDLTAQHPNKL